MAGRMDLHTHSSVSDGTYSPREVVRLAKEAGCTLVALSDHDTVDGVREAVLAKHTCGIAVLPALEMDTQSPFELHILGLGIDENDRTLLKSLRIMQQRRAERNGEILRKLRNSGIVLPALLKGDAGTADSGIIDASIIDTSIIDTGITDTDTAGTGTICTGTADTYLIDADTACAGTITRLHIALALCRAGYAKNVPEAFRLYLAPGMVGYVSVQRYTPEEAIDIIHRAGGIAVLAHPCHIRANPHRVVERLQKEGLDGIEALHSSSTAGQAALFLSLASQLGLLVTCGSDFHGENRAAVQPGCAWQDIPQLKETEAYLKQRYPDAFDLSNME